MRYRTAPLWTKRTARNFEYLTERSAAPKVVRVDPRPADGDAAAERPSEMILRLLREEGWDPYSDPELLDFLGTVEIEDRIPAKVEELIAEVLIFFAALDQAERNRLGEALSAAIARAAEEKMSDASKISVVLVNMEGDMLGTYGDLSLWRKLNHKS